MGIIEVATSKEFIEEMRKMFPIELAEEKSGTERYKLISATGNKRVVFKPRVSTRGLDTIFLRNADPIAAEKIVAVAKEIGVQITKCVNFYFDERKEPPIAPPKE